MKNLKFKNCKACGKELDKSANVCPSCGKDQRNFFKKHKILTAILAFIVIIFTFASLGDDSTETSKVTSNNTTAEEKAEKEAEDNVPMEYKQALKEIKKGRKTSHWIWYIFPQIAGLGFSSTSKYYSIKDKNEAIEYLKNNTLKNRLIEICEALLSLESDDATYVMGYPDDLKLKSSMTLFSEVSDIDVFKKVLDKFYNGEKDEMTISLLNK